MKHKIRLLLLLIAVFFACLALLMLLNAFSAPDIRLYSETLISPTLVSP